MASKQRWSPGAVGQERESKVPSWLRGSMAILWRKQEIQHLAEPDVHKVCVSLVLEFGEIFQRQQVRWSQSNVLKLRFTDHWLHLSPLGACQMKLPGSSPDLLRQDLWRRPGVCMLMDFPFILWTIIWEPLVGYLRDNSWRYQFESPKRLEVPRVGRQSQGKWGDRAARSGRWNSSVKGEARTA